MAKSTPLIVQVLRALLALLVRLAHRAPPEPMVKMALPVLWDLLVPLVRMGHKVPLVQLALLALLVKMVHKVLPVQSDLRDLLG